MSYYKEGVGPFILVKQLSQSTSTIFIGPALTAQLQPVSYLFYPNLLADSSDKQNTP